MLKRTVQLITLLFVYCSCCFAQQLPTARADLSDAQIQDILQERIDKYKKNLGIVVGIITDQGSRIISYGKMSEGDGRKPDGDTIYEIDSITKVFTTILLADMVQRGEVSLSDPISKFLPKSVKVPTKDDKEMTLIDLATHTSGLPRMADNMAYKDFRKSFANYSVDQMYQFLSKYTLPRSIGAEFEYSNLGMGLLGHILALRAGTDCETLVRAHICEPLKMNSTRIKLSQELQTRLAAGHDKSLKAAPNMDLPTLAGAGALRSTTNDLLRFLAANLGLVETGLTSAMQQTHIARHSAAPDMEMAMGWYIYNPFGSPIVWHSGGTLGYHTFIGFDRKKRMGVVVLSNSSNGIEDIGFRLLGTTDPWAIDRIVIKVDPKILDAYVGVYEISPNVFRYVTRLGNRLFLQRTGGPKFEIFPETETDFFIKDMRIHLTFIRENTGKVSRMILWNYGKKDTALKVDRPLPEEKRAIELDPKIYDAYAGHYQIERGLVFTITKEGDRLMAQLSRKGKETDWRLGLLTGKGKEQLFPESETIFFYRVVDAQITFVKDEKGNVTHLILHQNGDKQAKKID